MNPIILFENTEIIDQYHSKSLRILTLVVKIGLFENENGEKMKFNFMLLKSLPPNLASD